MYCCAAASHQIKHQAWRQHAPVRLLQAAGKTASNYGTLAIAARDEYQSYIGRELRQIRLAEGWHEVLYTHKSAPRGMTLASSFLSAAAFQRQVLAAQAITLNLMTRWWAGVVRGAPRRTL